MKIRRLEIQGFKSFVDRVSFDFTAPVTAIVGPNGCGKSNVVDAIRWAMGEQSAKNLRGRQMEDVIFAGSESRKPLGMAEVTITFSTEDGRAPGRYLAFPEIEVTRRLYRDGESEYLINRTPCRLMDITELFLDTGVGTKAYSIIEQGRIGTILLSRPEDRRFLIEEAAGVMKYKTRKQIALRKVETTRRNLERLQDILSEIRRRASSLQNQARKAERFRELREELRGVDLAIIASDLSSRLAEQEKTLRLEKERQEAIASLDARRQELENRLQVDRVDLLRREEELRDAQNRLFSLKERSIEAGGELQLLRDRIRHAEETIASTSREADELSRKVASTQGELESLSRESALLDREEHDDGAVDALQERITALEADEKRFAGEVEDLRRLLFAAEGERARGRSQAAAAAKRREVVEERLARHAREQAQMEASRADLTIRIDTLTEETGRIRISLEERRAVRDGLKGERTRLAAEEKSLSAELERIRTDVARAEARLQSLTEMANRYPGVGEGVRTLLSKDPERRLFKGTLAEYVDVPVELDRAVAASLAERLSVVIGSGPESVHEAFRLLEGGVGQVLILCSPPAPPPSPEGPLDRLVDHLSVDPRHASLITPFLADFVLVDTLDEAMQKKDLSPSSTFVTRDGTIVRPDGVVGVGVPGGEETELIRIRREIRDARRVHEERAGELERVRTGHRATLDRLKEVEARLAQLEREIHGEELRLLTAEKDLQRLVGDSSHVARRLEVLVLEATQLVEERDALEREIGEGERLAEAASSRAADISARLSGAESGLGEVRETLETLRRESTALKVRVATERERRASLCRRLDQLRRELSSMEERKERLERERQEAVASKEGLESALEEKRRRIALLTAEVEDAEERVRRAMEEHDALQGALRQREDEISTLRRSISQEQEALESLRTRAAGIAGELARLDAMLAERHRLSTAELLQMVAAGEVTTSPDRARYDELSQRISQMGEVNLTAIDEYRETMARHDFLSTQKKDLEDSLVSLEQAIRKINRTTRKRFLETFDLINDKFREVFPRLFCGGSAELRLTDEENLLETGIDIVVQPPGKRLQNVSLLSGGEKALTAVALIFAIFLIKPTPFCLLDEVDAPLDDANIGRFNDMIREMSKISQFILITHSKTTMTVADTLYGVTMEEPGVSKLVSVKLT